VRSRRIVSFSTSRWAGESSCSASAITTLRNKSSVESATGAFSSISSPVSAGLALLRRLSSMTIRRATVASQGISDGSVRSSLPA